MCSYFHQPVNARGEEYYYITGRGFAESFNLSVATAVTLSHLQSCGALRPGSVADSEKNKILFVEKKSIFANDIDNLLAVEDELNQSKGSKGPNNWLPPNKSFQCIYVKKFDKIVEKYKLIYRIEEKLFINHFLDNCYKYM